MATNIVQAEEQPLSLPINLHDQPPIQEPTQEDFDFCSWGSGPEMCVADQLFCNGQILPLRLSFSSQAHEPSHQKHHAERDFKLMSKYTSSSGLRSQNPSSTSSTTKPRISNQFHTHPSPKPQLRAPTRTPSTGLGRKSTSAWGVFRLGVVPAPEIGLQDIKLRNNRNCVSRNSSSSSSSNNSVKSVTTGNRVLKQFVGKGGGLLSGCDCSFETVMMKGGDGAAKSVKKTESTKHAAKEKVIESNNKKQKHKGNKMVITSRRRTSEWLKELHAAHHPDEEALLSNASS
ncbi:hypothetical protein Fmac_014678 [Flemingia macrophylla]|uniref:Uncharacterized protein n=1 Tax=Flemingia macrophylla TaxID=520843 RepID=A0ABD1MCF8_9FABA